MHPADQFEAFKKLAEERGSARRKSQPEFGVTPHVVRQSVAAWARSSPKLMKFIVTAI